MSFKSCGGNISKIKYFLPARKYKEEEARENIIPNYSKKIATNTSSFLEHSEGKQRKHLKAFDNKNRNSLERFQQRRTSKPQSSVVDRQSAYTSKHQQSIDVDVVGIKDVSSILEKDEKKSIMDLFPEQSEKQEFYQFLQELKNDQQYQNSITMFTILYYYQKKQKQPPRSYPKSAAK